MRKSTRLLMVLLLAAFDFAAIAASILISFQLLVIDAVPSIYEWNVYSYILVTFVVFVLCNLIFSCYTSIWKNAGMNEAVRQFLSVTIFGGILFVTDRYLFLFLGPLGALRGAPVNPNRIPRGMPINQLLIICLLLFLFCMAIRMSMRMLRAFRNRVVTAVTKKGMRRILVFGCGEAGSYLITKLKNNPGDGLLPIVSLDINESLWGRKINGVPCIGGNDKLSEAIVCHEIDEVIVAIPSATRDILQFVVDTCKKHRCAMRRFGTINDVALDDLSGTSIKSINLEDLLHRDSITLNRDAMEAFIKDKTVLVTGGCGSIGSEICRQVLSQGCKKLLVFDIDENGLFHFNNEIKETYDEEKYITLMGSVRDRVRLEEIFDEYHPQVVFHAAAHKHVPMMEINPREAIKNNVFGTINVAQVTLSHGAEKFILISTDKAVNPTNIMGASKRIAEKAIQMFDNMSDTDFAAVRFGNVLGSNGSVVPFFREQIERGGPVTVTDPKMMRYFMTIPEAVQLVLEAGAMAQGGEIFVLDMGKPVRILDLARDLITLSGYEPDVDIKIEFTGLRPGEKLFEEISLKDEEVSKTENNKIYVMQPKEYDYFELANQIKRLEEAVVEDICCMFEKVHSLVPTFNHHMCKDAEPEEEEKCQ